MLSTRTLAAALALACAAAPLTAQAPATLGDWLMRDKAAGALPPSAERDARIAALHQSLLEALRAARATEDARVAAGERPNACLPPPGEGRLTSQEVGTWLHARPRSEHGEAMTQVVGRFLAERYPCP